MPGQQQSEQEAVERAADVALAEDRPVTVEGFGLIVAPDTVMTEGMANNQATPATRTLRRADGRTVYVYKWSG